MNDILDGGIYPDFQWVFFLEWSKKNCANELHYGKKQMLKTTET